MGLSAKSATEGFEIEINEIEKPREDVPVLSPINELRTNDQLALTPDDVAWLTSLLRGMLAAKQRALLTQYQTIWIKAMTSPGLPAHQHQNAGRYAANTWIRIEITHG